MADCECIFLSRWWGRLTFLTGTLLVVGDVVGQWVRGWWNSPSLYKSHPTYGFIHIVKIIKRKDKVTLACLLLSSNFLVFRNNENRTKAWESF